MLHWMYPSVKSCPAACRFGGSQADRASAEASSSSSTAGKAAAAKGKAPDAKKAAAAKGDAAAAGKGKSEKGDKAAKGDAAAAGKGEKAAKAGGGGGAKAAAREVDVSLLDIRVALIKKAWRHPDAGGGGGRPGLRCGLGLLKWVDGEYGGPVAAARWRQPHREQL